MQSVLILYFCPAFSCPSFSAPHTGLNDRQMAQIRCIWSRATNTLTMMLAPSGELVVTMACELPAFAIHILSDFLSINFCLINLSVSVSALALFTLKTEICLTHFSVVFYIFMILWSLSHVKSVTRMIVQVALIFWNTTPKCTNCAKAHTRYQLLQRNDH